MSTIQAIGLSPHVTVGDDQIEIKDLCSTDPDVVAVIGSADNPETATHRVLGLGARCVAVAQRSLDSELIEQQVAVLTGSVQTCVDTALSTLNDRTTRLLDSDTGEVATMLAQFHGQLEEILGSTFDPDKKTSAIAKLEQVMESIAHQQLNAVRLAIDPSAADSPLHRWHGEMTDLIKEQIAGVVREIREVSEKVAVRSAEADILELTSAKGFKFEEIVHGAISRLAATHGDIAEQVGRVSGSTGSQVGDELVVVNADDTAGRSACFVLESKDRRLGMSAALGELDLAIANRDAFAGIAVFSSMRVAPTAAPFHYSGNRAIVVLDKDTLDESALSLAYMWARWTARRSVLQGEGSLADAEHVQALIDDARRGLERAAAIRRAHSTARKKIDEAAAQSDLLVDDVRQALDELVVITRS